MNGERPPTTEKATGGRIARQITYHHRANRSLSPRVTPSIGRQRDPEMRRRDRSDQTQRDPVPLGRRRTLSPPHRAWSAPPEGRPPV